MRRGPICKWQPKPPFNSLPCDRKCYSVLAPVSRSYPNLTGRLPTCYSPVRRSFHNRHPEGVRLLPALDLHVLGTPPAFVLSQDQTLHKSVHILAFRSKLLTFLKKSKFLFLKHTWLFCSVFKEQFVRRNKLFYQIGDFMNISYFLLTSQQLFLKVFLELSVKTPIDWWK